MPTPTGQENMAGALLTAQGICWNESHGYAFRDGVDGYLNPDVDCSYFVGYCLQQNGFDVSPSWYTGSMITDLANYTGFDHYIYSSGFQPMNGDIFVYDDGQTPISNGHTFFVAENIAGYTDPTGDSPNIGTLALARVEASSSRGNTQHGDQPKNGTGACWEVWVHPWSTTQPTTETWHVFRWIGGTPVQRALPAWLMAKNQMKKKYKKLTFI